MRPLRPVLLLMAFAFPAASVAQVTAANLPADTLWYLHADLDQLRQAESGRHLYDWLEREVFSDIREDIGIDAGKEAKRITAFADDASGTVIVVDGAISADTRNKLLALAALDSRLETLEHDGQTYYHVERENGRSRSEAFDNLDKAAWFSFGIKDKLIVASSAEQLKALLDSGGRIPGSQGQQGALLVLTADKSFVQAGVRTAAFADRDDHGWDSNILRNTELVALLVSDRNGRLAVEAQLVSHEPAMAQSLGGIINGLISLQSLNPDIDPDILFLVRNTRVEVKDKVLSINAVFDPQLIVDMMGN